MMNRKMMTSVVLGAIALVGMAAQAAAANVDERRYSAEVRSCVAEISNHVEYGDAQRVRHDVTLVKPKLVGYVMQIDTTIYNESADEKPREYATRCVVNGAHKPLKFEINAAEGA